MKLKPLAAATALCLCSLLSFSQEISFRSAREKNAGKQALFANAAERVTADANLINALFTLKTGQGTIVKFANNLQLAGHVVASEQQNGLQTITLRCTNFPGALLTISKAILSDGSVTYSGAIINQQSRDIIILEKDVQGNYAWQKKQLSDLIQD